MGIIEQFSHALAALQAEIPAQNTPALVLQTFSSLNASLNELSAVEVAEYKEMLLIATANYCARLCQDISQKLKSPGDELIGSIPSIENYLTQMKALCENKDIARHTHKIFNDEINTLSQAMSRFKKHAAKLLEKITSKTEEQSNLLYLTLHEILMTIAEAEKSLGGFLPEKIAGLGNISDVINALKTSHGAHRALEEINQFKQYFDEEKQSDKILAFKSIHMEMIKDFKQKIVNALAVVKEKRFNTNLSIINVSQEIVAAVDALQQAIAIEDLWGEDLNYAERQNRINAYSAGLQHVRTQLLALAEKAAQKNVAAALPELKIYAQIAHDFSETNTFLPQDAQFTSAQKTIEGLIQAHENNLQRAINSYSDHNAYRQLGGKFLYVNQDFAFALPLSSQKLIKLNFTQIKNNQLINLLDALKTITEKTNDPSYAKQAAALAEFIEAQMVLFAEQLKQCEADAARPQMAEMRALITYLPVAMQGSINQKLEHWDAAIEHVAKKDAQALVEKANDTRSLITFMGDSYHQFKFNLAAETKKNLDNTFDKMITGFSQNLGDKFKQQDGNAQVLTALQVLSKQYTSYMQQLALCNNTYKNERQYFTLYKQQHFTQEPIAAAYDGLLTLIENQWATPLVRLQNQDISHLAEDFSLLKLLLKAQNSAPGQYADMVSGHAALNKESLNYSLSGLQAYYETRQKRFDQLLVAKKVTPELCQIMDDLKAVDGVLSDAKQSGYLLTVRTYEQMQTAFVVEVKRWKGDTHRLLLASDSILHAEASFARNDFFAQLNANLRALEQSVAMMKSRVPMQELSCDIQHNQLFEKISAWYKDLINAFDVLNRSYVFHSDAEQASLYATAQAMVVSLIKLFIPAEESSGIQRDSNPVSIFDQTKEGQKAFYKKYDALYAAYLHIEQQEIKGTLEHIFVQLKKMLLAELECLEKIEFQANNPSASARNIARRIIKLKAMAMNIPCFKEEIDHQINLTLKDCEENHAAVIPVLSTNLLLYAGSEHYITARHLIDEHDALAGQAICMRNAKTKLIDPEKVLAQLSGTNLDRGLLRSEFYAFQKEYWQLVEAGLGKEDTKAALEAIVNLTKEIPNSSGAYKDKIRHLLTHLFAHWTLEKSANYYKKMLKAKMSPEECKNYLMQPHAAQIFGLLRLFSMDLNDEVALKELFSFSGTLSSSRLRKNWEKLFSRVKAKLGGSSSASAASDVLNLSHFAEVLTGEGKSVTLAMMAAVFALMGHPAHCASYSTYLSTRDYDDFKDLFVAFGLTDLVKYGTFDQLSEELLKQKGDIRGGVLTMMKGGKPELSETSAAVNGKNPHLLVDEVDSFFTKDFYSNSYPVTTVLKDNTITQLVKKMWAERGNKEFKKLGIIQASDEYKACIAAFPGWEELIIEAVKSMRVALNDLNKHQYVLSDDGTQIGYKEQDSVDYDQAHGYSTLFAYYQESEKNGSKITPAILDEKTGLYIKCGNFSYSQLLIDNYKYMRGVTGTLKDFNAAKRLELEKKFGVDEFSYIPSAYGDRADRFRFNPKEDVHIVADKSHFAAITAETATRLGAAQEGAVLVIFENEKELLAFYNSDEFKRYKEEAAIISPTLVKDKATKSALVGATATTGRVTLITKDLARGVDYVCYDERLIKNGGLHVLNAMVPETIEDQRQAEGRTARQGAPGSCSWVIAAKELKEKYGILPEDISDLQGKDKENAYEFINYKRAQVCDEAFSKELEMAKIVVQEHEKAEGFVSALKSNDKEKVKAHLVAQNRELKFQEMTPTVIMLDATGSMQNLLNAAKESIQKMFIDARAVLIDEGLDPDLFSVQILVYRNYNVETEYQCQDSGVHTNPNDLSNFLQTIGLGGGYSGRCGHEAIELAFNKLNGQIALAKKTGAVLPKQVILIGDAGPHTKTETAHYSRGSSAIYFDDEFSKFKENKIPVNTFYLENNARRDFEKIANESGGKSSYLNVHSQQAADILRVTVVEKILGSIGGKKLILAYHKMLANKGHLGSAPSSSSSTSSMVTSQAPVMAGGNTASNSNVAAGNASAMALTAAQ